MARSINSPGVQITETDLSQYQVIGGGTTVFVPGFAPQGPTDEIIQVSTISEFEQIYGTPTTGAERYFYYSAKEILNSPATLLTTRLPYGSGYGEGFANQYSALLFPVASATPSVGETQLTIGAPKFVNLTDAQYNDIIQNNVSWNNILSGNASLSSTTAYQSTSSVIATPTTSATIQSQVANIDPSFSITIAGSAVTFTFDVTLSSITYGTGPASFTNNIIDAGFIVLNSSKTALNETYEGYYLTVTDNLEFNQGSDFTSVNQFYSLSSQNDPYYIVPSSKYSFPLSGARDTAGGGSVSEIIEGQYDWTISQLLYNDAISINLFKVRKSIYDPQTLTISPVENYLGSLNSRRQEYAPIGGIPKTFFLQDLVNNKSSNLKLFVNPNIATNSLWTSTSASVRTENSVKALYPNSVWTPSYLAPSAKVIGNVVNKVERALTLVETSETVPLDIVCDAGLTTIYTTTSSQNPYEETLYIAPSEFTTSTTNSVLRYKTLLSVFNNFVQNTRKDCVFIADPVRQIFVTGRDTKTLSVRTNTFTGVIYTSLKNLYETINSNYTVTYGNWVKMYDAFADTFFWQPFSGLAAAIYARTDSTTQPWIAPAGLNRGIIPNVVDLGINPNQKQRDQLYTISVNPVVFFSGDGFVVFGQKTLQNRPSAFDRVNVRRLFLALEKATQQSLRYFVFEPNTEFTRTRLKNTITPIFELAKNTEGLYDYLIVCDERNNTPDVIDRNELAVDIYIKPVKAAEFILVNFIATRTGQNFQELI
jgi:hypothetical protein